MRPVKQFLHTKKQLLFFGNRENNIKSKVHFPVLPEQKPTMASEHADECENLQAFGQRFQDMNRKQKEFNILH